MFAAKFREGTIKTVLAVTNESCNICLVGRTLQVLIRPTLSTTSSQETIPVIFRVPIGEDPI